MLDNSFELVPPFYIFFFIFGTFYLKTLPDKKQNIPTQFSVYFDAIYNSFKKITETQPRTENIERFIANVKNYFASWNEWSKHFSLPI